MRFYLVFLFLVYFALIEAKNNFDAKNDEQLENNEFKKSEIHSKHTEYRQNRHHKVKCKCMIIWYYKFILIIFFSSC